MLFVGYVIQTLVHSTLLVFLLTRRYKMKKYEGELKRKIGNRLSITQSISLANNQHTS
jgi:hypothetical protein